MRKSIHSKEYAAFLDLLRQTREEAGLTQVEVATRLRMDQSTYSKCERGERRMDVIELWRWCGVVDVSCREFVVKLEKMIGASRT